MNLFIHGGPGFQEYLRPYFSAIPDGRFYGQKSPIETVDEAVQELGTQIGARPGVNLIGHSWGAILALEYASKHANVKSLVLMSAPLSFECEKDFAEEAQKRGLANPTPVDFFLSSEERKDPACISAIEKMMATFNPASIQNIFENYWSRFDLRPALSKLKIPVLVTYGSEDIRVPASKQREYRKLNPKIKTAEISGAGHFPFLLKAHRDELHKLLLGFLT